MCKLSGNRLTNWKAVLMAVVIMLASQGTSMAVQITATWNGGAGNWNVGGNWSGAVVPNNGIDTYNVQIDNGNGASSSVSLDMAATIDNLTIDALDSLGVNNALSLTVVSGAGAGTITNNGNIALNATTASTYLKVSGGNVDLTGGGTVTMSNDTQNSIQGVASTDRLTNVNNTIQGAGNIGGNFMALTNQGTINANQTATLTIDPSASGAVNRGTMKATGGSTLILNGGNFSNFEGAVNGLIRADASTVKVQSSTVTGGNVGRCRRRGDKTKHRYNHRRHTHQQCNGHHPEFQWYKYDWRYSEQCCRWRGDT